MNLRYRVHGASRVQVQRNATLDDGAQVEALVPALEIELVPEGHPGGSLVLRFANAGDDTAATFSAGALVEGAFTRVEG